MVVVNVPFQGTLIPDTPTRKVTFTVRRPPPPTGEELKEDALRKHEKLNAEWLKRARDKAYSMLKSMDKPEIMAEDVAAAMILTDDAPASFQVIGAIFHGDDRFMFTGRYETSKHNKAHARVARVWTLK